MSDTYPLIGLRTQPDKRVQVVRYHARAAEKTLFLLIAYRVISAEGRHLNGQVVGYLIEIEHHEKEH